MEDTLVYITQAHYTDQLAIGVGDRDTAEAVIGHLCRSLEHVLVR
jgi:hypothetical protein